MKDTSIRMQKKFAQLMKKKTAEERCKMAFSMYDMARAMVISSIQSKNPRINAFDLKKTIFLRLYGGDFTPEMKGRILRALLKTCGFFIMAAF